MKQRTFLWATVVTLLVAAALRLIAFGQVPPGLYHDEAYHGLDALEVLAGRFSLYFPTNNGREPLFIYLVTLTVGLLAKSPFALRLPSFFVGVLTVAATAAMGRTLFNRRVGWLAASVLAVTLWHIHLSRVGFRAVLLPLFSALAVWQAGRGIRTGRRRHWLAAGVLYGLSFYTYMAARFTPVALLAFGVYVLAIRPASRNFKPAIRNLALAALAAAITLAPLAIYTVTHWDMVLGRPGQVSILNPAINGGDFWGTLATHTLRTLEMFFVRGDRIWRHNVPWRPVFDPVLGVAFVLGAAVALRRNLRAAAAGFVLIWTAVMVLPTLLSEDAPHFLRAAGILPVVAFLPALGLDWLCLQISELANQRIGDRLSLRRWRAVGHFALALPLLFGLGSTAWAYFGSYTHGPDAGYWFGRGAVALGGRINGFLVSGWDGERMLHGSPADRHVYLDRALWEYWPTAQFLIAAPEAVTVGQGGGPASSSVAVFTWAYSDWRWAWELLPSPAEIVFEEGPPSQNEPSRIDPDPQPFTTYLAFYATPPPAGAPVRAHFSGGVELIGVEVTSVDTAPYAEGLGRVRVRLRWRATAPLEQDYVIFLHYLRDGARIAQADDQPAGAHYPTSRWRPGDVVNDDHFLADVGDVGGVGEVQPGRDALLFGFWEPETGSKLYLLDEAGNPAGDWIELEIGSDR